MLTLMTGKLARFLIQLVLQFRFSFFFLLYQLLFFLFLQINRADFRVFRGDFRVHGYDLMCHIDGPASDWLLSIPLIPEDQRDLAVFATVCFFFLLYQLFFLPVFADQPSGLSGSGS